MLACAGKHQVLIFVHSRKETAKTAKFLKEEALREDKLARFMGVSPATAPPISDAFHPLLYSSFKLPEVHPPNATKDTLGQQALLLSARCIEPR